MGCVVEGRMCEDLHEGGVHGPGQVELRDVLALLQRGEAGQRPGSDRASHVMSYYQRVL